MSNRRPPPPYSLLLTHYLPSPLRLISAPGIGSSHGVHQETAETLKGMMSLNRSRGSASSPPLTPSAVQETPFKQEYHPLPLHHETGRNSSPQR